MEKLQWEIYIPIFKNRFILQELGIAVGIPFGILITIIIILAKGDIFGSDARYALGLILLLLLLSFLLILLVYGGKYAPGFILDEKGITNYTQKTQAKYNRIINNLLIALGILSGRPAAIGSGMIAQSRQVVELRWKRIQSVKFYPKQSTILVRGGFTEKIAIFCTEENYAQVEVIIKEKTVGKGSR